jgi:thiaminase/transcriptional activator TenA
MLSDDLFAAAQPLWEAQLAHPFVRGIADGTLDEERFKRWLRQDYRYLVEFARVLAWATAKADRLESMSWYAGALDRTLNREMELHRRYAERFGIGADQLEREPMWPTTRAYTDFLVRTAADGDMSKLLAALLPCAWGYAYIGQQLAAGERSPDARYADWVAEYSSAEFAAVADRLRGELDRLAEGANAAQRARLSELFVLSSRYEWQFWEMCWRGEQWGPAGLPTGGPDDVDRDRKDHASDGSAKQTTEEATVIEEGRVSRGLDGTIRLIAAAVIRDGERILVWDDHDSSTGEVVAVPLAGGIEFGETGEQALARELDEEIGATPTRIRYLGLLEDIFDWAGQKRHELYLIYDVDLADRAVYEAEQIEVVEPDGSRYPARWRSLSEFSSAARLVPDGLLDLIEQART